MSLLHDWLFQAEDDLEIGLTFDPKVRHLLDLRNRGHHGAGGAGRSTAG